MPLDELIAQIGIISLGCSSVWFISRPETWKWKRWGYILGLAANPFWFYIGYKTQQWGIIIVSLWYTYSWGLGVWNYWIKPSDSS